jgi:DNA-binding transcriptional regulator YdaS (Cro superfamily)
VSSNNQRFPALREAIDKAGGITAFAKELGVRHQAVYFWFSKGYVPLKRAVTIERMTGVSRFQLVEPSVAEALHEAAANDVL